MNILIVGASGATGRLLVADLLGHGHAVKAVVRSADGLPEAVRRHAGLTIVEASVLDLSDAEMAAHVRGCDAVASCLGHNLTFRGLFGAPRRLVTEATRRLCDAIRSNAPDEPVRFVLMNTTGNRNRDLDERISLGQKCVIALLRLFLPPHADNEEAADHLRAKIGRSDPAVEWAWSVRTGWSTGATSRRTGSTNRRREARFSMRGRRAGSTWRVSWRV